MNLNFTAEELLYLYDLLLKNESNDLNVLATAHDRESLLHKVRGPILSVLQKEQEKSEKVMYKAWSEQEEKKIKNLKTKNLELNNDHVRRSAKLGDEKVSTQ